MMPDDIMEISMSKKFFELFCSLVQFSVLWFSGHGAELDGV
jgi:hypothetical protein